jgi:PAS domain S-box-containing protein
MKRFRTTYIIALILISIFVVVGELAVQLGLSTLSDDSRIINLSGRQRMLSEQITKNALILNQTSDYNEFQERKKELTEALANWRKAHEALQKGDITLRITKTANTKEIKAKFNELQPIFDEMKEAASKITTYEFNSLDSATRAELNSNTQILVNNEVKFLPIMDEITFMYDKEAKSKTNTVGIIAWAVGVSIIGLIIFLAIFFFEPVVKKMNNYLEEIEKQNKKIQASEAEIRQIAEKQLEANKQLLLAQKQMQEKNAELEKAKQATEKLLKEQEEANKKLALAQRELQKTLAEQNRTNQKLVKAQQELLQKAQELEKSEREMRALAEAQLEANEQLFIAQRKAEEALKQEEKTKQELLLSVQKQDVLNKILQKSIATNTSNLKEFFDFTIDTLSEVRFLELLPGVGIFTKKEGDVYEMIAQKNISPKIQELYIRTGQCLCGLAIKTKETQYAHCVDERHTTRFEGIKEHGHYNVPILYQDEALGALVVYLPHGHKREQSEIDFLEAVCNIIANTIISVRKEQELERSEREMRALAEAQLEANEQLLVAQRKMQEAQKELQRLSLVASKTDNIVIISDANGLIEWVNEGFERLTEYKLEEVKGKKPGAFLQGVETNPADVQTIREGLANRKPFYAEIYNYSKSGKGYWLGLNITPIFDENGSLTQFIAIETDITERKKAELEIKELLEMQTAINDTLMLAQQEAAQKAQELERSEKEMRALAEAQLEANEKLMLAQKEAQEALLKAKKAEEEMRMLAEAQLEANERLMLAEKQLKESLELEQKQKAELDRLVARLKETQSQLVHNEKMASLGQLTAGIAHEINNPINFVYNGIDTLKVSLDDLMEIVNKYNELDNADGNKDAVIEEAKKLKQQLDFEELIQDIEHLVADIKRGAIRTMEIVKGLRVFSRLDEEERKMASIKECLESTLILLNNKMKNRIQLKKYYDETMPEIMCYPGQLNQVFMNIINNAIQAIPEDRKDGEISIYTENQQENVVIRIKDNGIGMSEQVKRRIFEPFFTTKPVGVGTGLGLSITFGIIEKHGGNIFVNSEEGKGTEFVIQLPKQKI